MSQKSIKINAMLASIQTVMSLIFPLITFPYISRVLQVEAIGQYNFSASIVGYFLLLAELGISTYALREGTRLRNDRMQISRFAGEMLLLHILAAAASLFLLTAALICVQKLQNYWLLIVILSLQIPLMVFGRVWLYQVYEDFGMLTLTQVVLQGISVILMFIFVHTPRDLWIYTVIHLITTSGANLIYGIRSKKYIDPMFAKFGNLKRHLKPILLIFFTAVTSTIYINSDTTILGWVVDDEAVGLYSVAVKIYNIVKKVIVAVITVIIPRLTQYAGTDRFNQFFNKVFKTLSALIIPAMFGVYLLSENIVCIIAGPEYLAATGAMRFLSIALGISLFATLFASGVLLPHRQEKRFLIATVASALLNVVLNFLLIPYYHQTAAAFTTLLAELTVLLLCYYSARPYISLNGLVRSLLTVGAGCGAIIAVCLWIKSFNLSLYLETIMCVGVSVIVYCAVQLLLKNEAFTQALKSLQNMRKRKGQ